ncbi:MAG: VWA domain-containing protein [Proteobacteria bacterium]|nr:VWA domain-containing protein [Pseudomonadota bacterium]
MSRHITATPSRWWLAAALLFALVACESNSDAPPVAPDNDAPTNNQDGTPTTPDDGAPNDTPQVIDPGDRPPIGIADSDTPPVFQVCGEVTQDLIRIPSRAMLLLDRSSSMRKIDTNSTSGKSKWEIAIDAITDMVATFEGDIIFGLDMFSHAFDPRGGIKTECWFGEQALIDVDETSREEIIDLLAQSSPYISTPLYLGMANYTKPNYAPVFQDREAASYLIVISDGKDTCGTEPTDVMIKGDTSLEDLSALSAQLLNEHDIKTIVIGFGSEADPAQLNAVAIEGGTKYTEFIDAIDADALDVALREIVQSMSVSCLFQLGELTDPDSINLDWVNVTFDGTPVPRDDGCQAQQGWTWANADRTAIQFCSQACQTLESGSVDQINVQMACSEEDVIIIMID